MFGLFKKKQLPKKVLLLSGIPDNQEQFRRLAENGKSDFLNSLASLYGVSDSDRLWNSYSSSAKSLQSAYKAIESRGGKVIRNFSLQDLCHLNEYDIVIIIAHHSDDSDEIEVGGEMVRTMDFVNAIPKDSQIILDLTSCYSAYLIPKLKAHVPFSKIIGIEVKTKLSFRLFLLEKVLEYLCKNNERGYIGALQDVLSSLPKSDCKVSVKDATPDIHLGGKLQSTIYAPKQVLKGEDFIVSVFLHKQENSEEIEIIAKSVDDTSEKRNVKHLSVKIRKGDKVDFQFSVSKEQADFFIIDKRNKGFVWDGEINNVEFIVSVLKNCSVSSFIGNVKIFVNKEPIGDMAFKTAVVEQQSFRELTCAGFEFIPFDKQAEMNEAQHSLLQKLSEKILSLDEQLKQLDSASESELMSEMEICKKCRDLLKTSYSVKKNPVLRVFISSTSDMEVFRKIVKERVEACEMYPDMYENWGQGNDYPRDMCCKHVLQSDIFVCILGVKYGFIEPIWDKSMTEIEFRIAQNAGLPILIYVVENYKEEMEKLVAEERQKAIRQEIFIDELKDKRLVGIFQNELGLSLLVNSELLTIKHKLQS